MKIPETLDEMRREMNAAKRLYEKMEREFKALELQQRKDNRSMLHNVQSNYKELSIKTAELQNVIGGTEARKKIFDTQITDLTDTLTSLDMQVKLNKSVISRNASDF